MSGQVVTWLRIDRTTRHQNGQVTTCLFLVTSCLVTSCLGYEVSSNLLAYREEYLCELCNYLGKGVWENLTKDVIMDIIMDVTRANVVHSMQLNSEQCIYIERISRYLCHRVHSGRIFLLEKVSRGKRGPSGS